MPSWPARGACVTPFHLLRGAPTTRITGRASPQAVGQQRPWSRACPGALFRTVVRAGRIDMPGERTDSTSPFTQTAVLQVPFGC